MNDAETSEVEPEGQSGEPCNDFVVERGAIDDLVEKGLVLFAVLLASFASPAMPSDGVELMVAHRHER